MKIKIFNYLERLTSLKDFEERVNDFLATVEVVSVKYQVCQGSEGHGRAISVLVLYK